MRRFAVVLALTSACTFHHAVEIGGGVVATAGVALIAGTQGRDDCSDGIGQCTFGGSIDAGARVAGEVMLLTGLAAAFIALVTDHPAAPAVVNQLPR
jgi:hypothetical protein